MIICKITSGFGNQLFQYFTAYSLSKELDCDLFLDITSFKKDKQRSFLLSNFDMDISIWENSFLVKLGLKKIKDKGVGYQNIEIQKGGRYFLKGYWQTPLYFKKHEKFVRQSLFSHIDLHSRFKIEKHFKLISIHVRRGDYVNNPVINSKFNVCELDYFRDAINIMYRTLNYSNLHFIILSDDYEFVNTSFRFLESKTIINGDTDKPIDDFNIMINCNHNIISNSTFSWWGAWVNPNSNKIVISPKEWFKDPKQNHFLKDLLLENWIKI